MQVMGLAEVRAEGIQTERSCFDLNDQVTDEEEIFFLRLCKTTVRLAIPNLTLSAFGTCTEHLPQSNVFNYSKEAEVVGLELSWNLLHRIVSNEDQMMAIFGGWFNRAKDFICL